MDQSSRPGQSSCDLDAPPCPPASSPPPITLEHIPDAWHATALAPLGQEGAPLGALDVYAGAGNMSRSMNAHGTRCEMYDKVYSDVGQNVLCVEGLAQLIALACRVTTKGVVWIGPECSTWVWLSRGHTKRSKSNIEGDTSRSDVTDANHIATITAGLVQLCHARRVWYVIEQPLSSLLYHHPGLAAAIKRSGGRRYSVELGRAGATSPKPLVLVGTAPWLPAIERSVKRRPMVETPEPVVKTSGRWISGDREALAKSAVYPQIFTDMVGAAHADYLAHRPGTSSFFRQTMHRPGTSSFSRQTMPATVAIEVASDNE